SSPVPALYSRTALSLSPNPVAAPAPPILLLSGYGDPIHRLDQPWIVAWNALYRGNCAISRVGLSPNMATAQPMELGIEMRTESIQANLSDGAITWLDLTLVDVPTGSSPGFVRIYQWSFGAGQWLPYDEHPQVTPIPDGWLAKTFVHAPVNNAWLSDFYAAAIVPRGASATTWMLYE
ncbi:hypothetical protein HQ520_08685, partial [bacterium]|nr:hypothetical protein [bacterium]